MAILDKHYATNELVEMRNSYSREIDLLAVVDSHLKERCSKLYAINDNSYIGNNTLLETGEGVEKTIELYQAYSEIDFK